MIRKNYQHFASVRYEHFAAVFLSMRPTTERIIGANCLVSLNIWFFTAFIAVMALVSSGCAVRPGIGIIDAEQAYGLIEARADAIRDFSGTALVQGKESGLSAGSARLSIRFMAPDRYRIVAKAFAGIPLGVFVADSDSATVFFPSDNAYITVGRNDELTGRLTGGYGIDPDRLISILTGLPSLRGEKDAYRKTIEWRGKRAVLILDDGTSAHRLLLEGGDCRVVEETVELNGAKLYTKRASRFRTIDGVRMPGRITLETERGFIDIEFSDCAVNRGMTIEDVSFVIPPGAERLTEKDLIGYK